MTGTAGTNRPAVMVKLNIIIQANLQQTLVVSYVCQRNGFQSLLLKFYLNRVHESSFWDCKSILEWGFIHLSLRKTCPEALQTGLLGHIISKIASNAFRHSLIYFPGIRVFFQ